MKGKPISSEIYPGPGFRIKRHISRPAQSIVFGLARFPTAELADLMNRIYSMDAGVKNHINNNSIAGSACTVRVFAGDNLMVHKALDIAQPGDVIVVGTGGKSPNAIMGDLVSTKASHRSIAGFVIDGLIRDVIGIKKVGMPIFCRGITPIGPFHRGPGEINYPVSCGGVVVNPGDIIVGDADGVVVVPRESGTDILEKAIKRQQAQNGYVKSVKGGEFSNEWVDKILDREYCEFDLSISDKEKPG